MPRNYKRKTLGPSYSRDDLLKAVADVENKNKTFREAEDCYGVPKAVIFHRIKGRKVPEQRMGAGRPTALPIEAEIELVNCIRAKARMGYPCDKDEVKEVVAEYVQSHNLETPFKDGAPGDDWYYSFLKRHTQLSVKKPEHLQRCRKVARKPEIIYDFYDDLQKLVDSSGVTFPEKACFMFNADESGFCSDPKRLKAIGERGLPLSRVSGGSGRDSTSVLATISADGYCLPPLIIFKGAAVQARWTSTNVYPGTLYATSFNGWMEEPVFFEWLTISFIPHVENLRRVKNMPNQAALLLFDGHKTHISYRIIKAAIDNKIELLKLPAHLSDRLQPLDKAVFKPVKDEWEKKLIAYTKKKLNKREYGAISKCQFSELLGDVWKAAMKPQNIISGFASTGTFPVDSSKFQESFFDPTELKRYKEYKSKRAEVESNEPISSSSTSPSNSITISSNSSLNSQPNVNASLNVQPNCVSIVEPSQSRINAVSQSDVNQVVAVKESPSSLGQPINSPHQKAMPANRHTPESIIEIFASKLNSRVLNHPETPKRQASIPRLKAIKYGEILTTEEVLAKQKEAEEAKLNKKRKVPVGKNKGKKTKKSREEQEEVPNESSVEELVYQDDSDDNLENWAESVTAEALPEVVYESPIWGEMTPGKYVLVDFLGGVRNKSHYKYVCEILSIDDDDGEIFVQGYKRIGVGANQFTMIQNDRSSISFDMVLAVLPDPETKEIYNQIVLVFPGQVGVFEK